MLQLPGPIFFTVTKMYIGPHTGSYTGMWPITFDVSNGVVRAVDESYTRIDLEYLQNPLMLSNLNQILLLRCVKA